MARSSSSKASPPTLRWYWRVGLIASPIAFQVGSVLACALAIQWTMTSAQDHSDGELWIVLLVLAIPLFQFGGACVGFALNAWLLHHRLGWSRDQIAETGVCLEPVARWLELLEACRKPVKQVPASEDPLYDPQIDHSV